MQFTFVEFEKFEHTFILYWYYTNIIFVGKIVLAVKNLMIIKVSKN